MCNLKYQVLLNAILSEVILENSTSFNRERGGGSHSSLVNLKHVDEINGILHAYLRQWLACFCMLTMLFYSLDQVHAYKDF